MKTQNKTELESARLFILMSEIVTEEQYSQAVYDIAQEFLYEVYGNDTRLTKDLESDKRFWRWWQMQWDECQRDLIRNARMCEIELTPELWWQEMRALAHEVYTEKSFINYLKLYRNVRPSKQRHTIQKRVRARA